MNENKGNQPSASDEIDLGQLFRLIGKGFDGIFQGVLKTYLYFKRNIAWLTGLLVLGVAIGLVLRMVTERKQRLDVIVTPNLNSKEYLADVVSEISSDIKVKDPAFLNNLGLDLAKMEGFEIELTSLREEQSNTAAKESEFLELLKDFSNTDAIVDIVRNELVVKTTNDHRITFFFRDPDIGEDYGRKIIKYINSNEYFQELNAIYRENAMRRIERNDSLIDQINVLVRNYSEKMAREQVGSEGRLILENQETLDVPQLLSLKNSLVRDSEAKRLELITQKEPITVVSFGKPYEVTRTLLEKRLVQVPLILIGGFLLLSFMRHLDQKARQRNLK